MGKSAELQQKNAELQKNFEQSDQGLVLLAEALSLVHEVINLLSRRTGTAAELLKTAVRTMTVTRTISQEGIDEMTTFFQENKDKITEMVQSGSLAVRKVHTALPELGRLIFYHDDETKQRLAKWIEENSGSGNAEGDIGAEHKDDAEDTDDDDAESEEEGNTKWQGLIKNPENYEAF